MTTLAIERPTGKRAPQPELPNPFPGLRPFTEDESDLFFGREQEVATVLKLLEHQQLVVVHGASGCGKSSVVRAGVVPVFRLDALANGAKARVIVIRPADADGPLASLAKKLEREFPRKALEMESGEDLATLPWSTVMVSSPDIARDISQAAREANATLCLVIDQFEEIFSVNRGDYPVEARRLIQFLLSLGEAAVPGTALGERPLSVILTMRSDYLGLCALWDGFAETVNRCQYLLPKMSNVGVLRAIHEPARRFGGTVTETAANRLLPVMSRVIDGLPILQHALMRSWQIAARPGGVPTIDADTFDAIGGLERALSLHAEEAFALATGGTKPDATPARGPGSEIVDGPMTKATEGDPILKDAANWILRSLSDLDTDARIIRRSVKLVDLPSETGADIENIRAILDVFRAPEFSLITPYSPETEKLVDESVISVSHEAVLRQWNRVSDPGFDGQQPKGLVQREFLDGLVARALSVQARDFDSDSALVLNPASTEARLPWFEEIARRPGWIARYPLQRRHELSHADQALEQWYKLKSFMEASKVNLDIENNRLQIEICRVEEEKLLNKEKDKAVKQLNLVKRYLIIMIWCVIIPLILITGYLFKQQIDSRELAEQGQRVAAELETANFLAGKECAGLGLEGQSCPLAVYKKYYTKLGVSIPDTARFQQSPPDYYGGGLRSPNVKETR